MWTWKGIAQVLPGNWHQSKRIGKKQLTTFLTCPCALLATHWLNQLETRPHQRVPRQCHGTVQPAGHHESTERKKGLQNRYYSIFMEAQTTDWLALTSSSTFPLAYMRIKHTCWYKRGSSEHPGPGETSFASLFWFPNSDNKFIIGDLAKIPNFLSKRYDERMKSETKMNLVMRDKELRG